MKISGISNILSASLTGKNNILKKYNNLKPLKADTFSFSGKTNTEERNPADYETFKNILLSSNAKSLNEDGIKAFYIQFMSLLTMIKEDNKSDFPDTIKAMKVFGEKYPLENLAFHVYQSCALSKLIKIIKSSLQIYKLAGYSTKYDDIIDAFPHAKLLLMENGILNSKDLNKYLESIDTPITAFNTNSKENNYHYIQIQIYSKLDNKKDLADYSTLLIYASNGGESGYINPDFNPNELTAFLKTIGLKNIKDFKKKFDYLAHKYNDFENIWDMYDAIMDLKKEYPQKIKLLKELATKYPDKIKARNEQEFAEIYAQHNNLADYIYSKQNDKSYAEDLPKYVDFLTGVDKLSESTIKEITKGENSDSSEALYNTLEIFKETNVSIEEVEFIKNNAHISDNDLLDCIINKEDIAYRISVLKNISQADAEHIYLNFASEYNALIKEANKKDDKSEVFEGLLQKDKTVEEFTNILERYGILGYLLTNPEYDTTFKDMLFEFGFANNYNRKKQISSAKFVNIVGMLQLFESKEKIKEQITQSTDATTKEKNKTNKKFAKKSKDTNQIAPHRINEAIKHEKDIFKTIKPAIIKYLSEDDSDFYSGKTIFEIYKIIRNLQNSENKTVNENKKPQSTSEDQVYTEVRNILDLYRHGHTFDIKLSHKLESLIPDKELLNNFRINNEISLISDDADRDEEYIQNCLKVLSLFNGNMEEYGNIIKYYSNSDFLKLSRKSLTMFFEKYNTADLQHKILTGIAKAKIININQFNRFIKDYSDKDEGFENLIAFLNNLPEEMWYDKFIKEFYTPLKERLRIYNLPYSIDNSNILNIDYNYIKPIKDCKQTDINKIINSISGAKEGTNFISTLPELYIEEADGYYASKGNIINEYLNCKDKVPYEHLDKVIIPYNNQIEESSFPNGKYMVSNNFLNLINDTSWIKVDENHIFNMSLHAKMRFIDRFIMPEIKNIDDLYTPETKEKMKDLITEYYDKFQTASIHDIGFDSRQRRIFSNFESTSGTIKGNFSGHGNLVTIYRKYDK